MNPMVSNAVSGMASPGTIVELFVDSGGKGQFFQGSTTAAADGSFTFTMQGSAPGPNVTALIIDAQGNASPFSSLVTIPIPTPTPTATPDPTAQTGKTIYLPIVTKPYLSLVVVKSLRS